MHDVELTYITSRGKWYDYSWKGDVSKSGGIATNIGIHFFDMLIWIFGDIESVIVHKNTSKVSSGLLRLKKANVKWFLSTDNKYIPNKSNIDQYSTFRSIKIDNEFFDTVKDVAKEQARFLGQDTNRAFQAYVDDILKMKNIVN